MSASDDAVVLRNFEGMLIRYQAEDKTATIKPTATRGVSALLEGSQSALIPENTERMARRELNVLTNAELSEETECGSAEGHASVFHVPLSFKQARAGHEAGNGTDVDNFGSELTPMLANGEGCHG